MRKIFTLIVCFVLFLCSDAQPPNYAFQAESGIYTPLVGGTVAVISSGDLDDGFSNALPIGFTFNYNGTAYTTISASANGWTALGTNITLTTSTTNLTAGANRPKLAPLYEDIALTNNANLTYATTGAAGTRVFTLQYANCLWDFNAGTPSISFQVKLYEATGVIEFVYQQEPGTVELNSSGGAAIGITTTATGSGSFLSLSDAGPNPSVSSTVETLNIGVRPATGQIYRWIPYCTASATNTTGEKISNFTYNTINNTSSSTAGYQNFTNTSTTVYLFPNSTLPFSATISSPVVTDQVKIFIDFNHDGDFDDTDETVYISSLPLASGTITGNITIPALSSSVLAGRTRLRIRLHDANNGPNDAPCGASTWGEVEDYSIDIQQCVAASIATQPANLTLCNGSNGSISVGASGTGLTYQWQISVDGGSTFTNLANNSLYSGVTTSTLNLIGATLSMNNYQYRVLVNGICTSNLASNAVTLSINTAGAITTNPIDKNGCVGTSVSFTAAASGTSPSYQWQVSTDGGFVYSDISGATNTTYTIPNLSMNLNGNRYRCVAAVVSCGSVITTPAILTVYALPVVTVSVDPNDGIKPGITAYVTGGSVPAPVSYVWKYNGTVIPGATSRSVLADVNANGPGKYSVTVTDINGCVANSSEIDVKAMVSNQLFIYPNPNDGRFTVRWYSYWTFERFIVTITNMSGAVVAKKEFNSNNNYYPMQFDLRGLATGIYIVHAFDPYTGTDAIGKVFIQR